MFFQLIQAAAPWVIPGFLLVVFLHALWRRVPVFATFVEGAQEGFALAVRLMPYVVGIYVAIAIFRQSGAMDWLVHMLAPLLAALGVPADILPLAVVRPLSGPAALGLVAEILQRYGPDSLTGRMAAVMEASTDTTFYILAVYFASVGVRRARYSLPVGLIADAAGMLATVYISLRLYG